MSDETRECKRCHGRDGDITSARPDFMTHLAQSWIHRHERGCIASLAARLEAMETRWRLDLDCNCGESGADCPACQHEQALRQRREE